jgi:hypothetical protein
VIYMGLLGFVGAVILGWVSFILVERFYFRSRRPVDLASDSEGPVQISQHANTYPPPFYSEV